MCTGRFVYFSPTNPFAEKLAAFEHMNFPVSTGSEENVKKRSAHPALDEMCKVSINSTGGGAVRDAQWKTAPICVTFYVLPVQTGT